MVDNKKTIEKQSKNNLQKKQSRLGPQKDLGPMVDN